MGLILISIAGLITGALVAHIRFKARCEKEAQEAKRAKWREYAARKRARKAAARGG